MTPSQIVLAIILALTAASCAIPGTVLVLRRQAMLSDAIGHSLLPGVVIAYALIDDMNSPLLLFGAALSGWLAVVIVEALTTSRLVKEDAAIGLTFPALFALGVLLVTISFRNVHLDVDRVLLGMPELAGDDRFLTSTHDFGPKAIWLSGGLFLFHSLIFTLAAKEIRLTTFDPDLAKSFGYRPMLLRQTLMFLVSLTAVSAFNAAGPVLVVAFFVVPTCCARYWTDRYSITFILSVLFACIGAILGTIISVRWNLPTSGTVAMTLGVLWFACFLISPRYGLIVWMIRRFNSQRKQYQ